MHRVGSYMTVAFFFSQKIVRHLAPFIIQTVQTDAGSDIEHKSCKCFSAIPKSRSSTEYACVHSFRLLPVSRNSEHATYPSCDQKLHTS